MAASPSSAAIETSDLRKVYPGGKVAVEGLTLHVERGEVFGFLGPNGAGKTTAVKMMLDLVHPTRGDVRILGRPAREPEARRNVGFLPEDFRFHGWMRADEFLDVHGELQGMGRAERAARIPPLLERVQLADASTQRLRTFSKGMLQRIGLAMALMHHPKLVFLDEPTSGLDPFGRMLVREIVDELRAAGTTVFLNSHLLGEVEATCDRVAFIRRGRVVQAGTLADLAAGPIVVRLRVDPVTPALLDGLAEWGSSVRAVNKREVTLFVDGEDRLPDLAAWVIAQGARLYALSPERASLETLFVHIMGGDTPGEGGRTA